MLVAFVVRLTLPSCSCGISPTLSSMLYFNWLILARISMLLTSILKSATLPLMNNNSINQCWLSRIIHRWWTMILGQTMTSRSTCCTWWMIGTNGVGWVEIRNVVTFTPPSHPCWSPLVFWSFLSFAVPSGDRVWMPIKSFSWSFHHFACLFGPSIS